jgi:hypothetical protein
MIAILLLFVSNMCLREVKFAIEMTLSINN